MPPANPSSTNAQRVRAALAASAHATASAAAHGTPPPSASSRMALTAITRGKLERPIRVLVYGVEGVGKSSFAADAPAPIFIAEADGTRHLDVPRFPQPVTWSDVLEAIENLIVADHAYRTLVIDTLDWLEPYVWQHVIAHGRKSGGARIQSIEDFGYGKGYAAALDQWRVFLGALERLRNARGMNVIMLAHCEIRNFKNPELDDFDRYQMKLHAKSAGLLREWCDVVMFAMHETLTRKVGERYKGVASGARVLYTERRAAWDAKNRFDLPDKLPLDWSAFVAATSAHRPADPAQLQARIAELCDQLTHTDPELAERARGLADKAGDNAAELARIRSKLIAALPAPDEDEEGSEARS